MSSRVVLGPALAGAVQSGESCLVVRAAHAAIPRLSAADATETEATTLLRRWASTWITIVGSPESGLLIEEDYWRLDVETLYGRFLRKNCGVVCGGTAWTLMRLYEAFGLESWTYSFGFPGTPLTHSVTLVRADGKVIVQDAYANYTVAHEDRPAAIADILTLIRSRRAHELLPVSDPGAKELLLTRREFARRRRQRTLQWPEGEPRNLVAVGRPVPGVVACRVHGVVFARLETWSEWPRAAVALASLGLPPSILYMMGLPLGLSSDADGWTPLGDARDTRTNALLRDMLA